MEGGIEGLLKSTSENYFKNEETKNNFCILGRSYFQTRMIEYKRIGYGIKSAKYLSLMDTIEHLAQLEEIQFYLVSEIRFNSWLEEAVNHIN